MQEKQQQVSLIIKTAVEALKNKKANNITTIDLTQTNNALFSHFIICDAQSTTHVEALAGEVEKKLQETLNEKPLHINGRENAFWVLLDYFDVVVHVFLDEYRHFYKLEELWADGKIESIAN